MQKINRLKRPLFCVGALLWAAYVGAASPNPSMTGYEPQLEALRQAGDWAGAERLARQALEIDEKVAGAQAYETSTDLNNLGEILIDQSRYKEAEPLLQRALAIRTQLLGLEHADTAQIVANVGALYCQEGRYAESEPLMRQALATYERVKGPESSEAALAMNNLGELLRTESRLVEAEPLMRRALALEEKTLGPQNGDTTASVTNLGLMMLDEGRYQEAESLFRRALATREKVYGRNNPSTLYASANLGLALMDQGRRAEAETFMRRSITGRGPIEGDGIAASAATTLGILLRDEGHYAEANDLLMRSSVFAMKTMGKDNPTTLDVLENLALNEQYQGNFEEAVRYYRTACQRRAGGRVRDQNSGALQASRALTNQCSARLSLSLWSWAAKGGAPPINSPDALMLDAFAYSQRAVQSAGSEALSRSAALSAATGAGVGPQAQAYEAALRERDGLDAQFAAAASDSAEKRAALTAARAAAVADIDRLAAELKIKAPRFWDFRAPKLMSTAMLQSKTGADAVLLHDDEALIVFLVVEGKEAGLVFAVTKEQVAWARLGLSGDALKATVIQLRSEIDPEGYGLVGSAAVPNQRPGAFDRQAAFLLYQQLLGDASIQAVIKSKSKWLFVPSGPLTSLPPGLLVTAPPMGGRAKDTDPDSLRATAWLLRSKAVALLPAVSSLRTLRQMLPANPGSTPDPLLAFADPDFTRPSGPVHASAPAAARGFKAYFRDGLPLAEALNGVPSLPGTRVEGQALVRALQAKPESLLLGRDASKAQLMARNQDGRLAKVRVLEFATHGLVAGDATDLAEPALVLAAGEKPQDELLLASEAATLKLNADWVLLSACNTASPDAPETQGLSGLSRAFFYAGAKSLLVSHWRVRDDVAPVLIPAMMRAEREHPDLSRAESLRQASMAILDDRTLNAADPSAWAAFTLVGEPGR